MDIAVAIAKRIAFNASQSFSRFIIRLATAATVVSVAAMIITLAFVNGFQKTVSEKVFSFWGHIRVQQFEPSKSLVAEETPLEKNADVLSILHQIPDVGTIQSFATKSAVLQKGSNIEGVLFKGVEQDYNFSHLQAFLKQGRWLQYTDELYSREIVLSQPVAEQLQVKINDTVNIHFIDAAAGKSNFRRLRVTGIYRTGIEEYDKLFVIGDLRLVQRLNNWKTSQIGGYEIFINDYHKMDTVNTVMYDLLPAEWISRSVREIYPNIFDWLNIQDVNRNVIFVVMSLVAIINLVTCLLILVLERTRMVGILKAVGGRNWLIQKIFLYHASFITIFGVGLGLIVGVGLCLLQQYTGFIRLDESAYYVSQAPVQIVWWQVVAICLGTTVVCFFALIIPTLIVRSIQPVKAIQFR
ncbi:ABC transporter permease [Segetibacter sp. 3557_3]|uniref:ABC transporter permease n=1 Tax=Segetibacter sp. 3557_3 TaxID=2547429 RepID=UPI0010588383|nr:ABC transporter permease [Segetibacter sp. 3557_3]TDH29234.1 ABC transporter permease [Segetibacter sp. 3557_3]